ncbi:hypothetical protein JHJ32_00405 [Parapedobacter sp. ISTM3]|uniref:hypothetical protein n=1 Tax=Parapedobacter sp. ISTM3 TaxID=2800130 RepID=UPI0019063D6E|nr:hypothetical protein [Parapedobacter sp. ISTM3]MBK1438432.1 hypothetical protein [Parapedobacter sp. ISTM3]
MQKIHQVEKIEHTLELDEKLSHQQKGWNVQRVCGILILIVVVLTALGLFGNGLLSKRQLANGGTALRYDRFLRYEKETTITWQLSGRDEIEILIPMRYLDAFKIEKITPEGYESRIVNGNVSYTFTVAGAGETAIYFYLNPQKAGSVADTWRVNDQAFEITHFIYP